MSQSLIEMINARARRDDFKLPVFNPIALELQAALNSDRDMTEIECLILQDQALSSEILRIANSALFSGLAKLDSIQQALVRLGTNQVFSIVMTASQRAAYNAEHPFLNELMTRLWQQASGSAGGCRWLANKIGFKAEADHAFLCGLLHDLGSLVILQVLDEILEQDEAPEITEAVIIELINTLHNEYGYQVMNRWELPEHYAIIARDHALKTCDDKDVLLQITRLVDSACRKVGIGLDHEPDLVLEAVHEAQLLGVKPVVLAELEIELEDFVEQLA